MIKSISRFILVAGLCAAGITAPVHAQETLSPDEKEAIGKFIREHLVANPDIVLEALEAHQVRQHEEQQQKFRDSLVDYRDEFMKAPYVGAENPKTVVVEFFDYNCGYCKRAFEDVQMVVDEFDDVRVVLMEMPILSQSSRLASKWALAAEKQGKYWEYHAALMEFGGPKTEDTLADLAEQVGLDVEQAQDAVENDESLDEALMLYGQIAGDLGIRGTPAFIIDGELFGGYLGTENMRSAVQGALSGE